MADKRKLWIDVPDLAKIEEKGISINAPTPKQFVIVDPWKPPSGKGVTAAKVVPGPADPPKDRSTKP
jgi:hypothetical protein